MTLDPDLVRAGRRLRDRLAELGAEVDRVLADLRGQVGQLHAAGGSPEEIATAVGLGERQVREMLEPGTAGAAATQVEADSAAGQRQPPPGGWGRLACSFCGTLQHEAGRLIAGPGVAICDRCAVVALDLLVEGRSDRADLRLIGGDPRDRTRCSFCGKRARRVGGLVAGAAGVHICGECLDLCADILRDDTAD
jgi:ClpX C4-type zinc finger